MMVCCRKQFPAALLLAVLLSLVGSLTAFAHTVVPSAVIGPGKHYLALGDSFAFGYQPDLDFNHGYADYLGQDLRAKGVKDTINLSCPGETSTTMIEGDCPYPFLRKYLYLGSQLNAASAYIFSHRGQVSPVTLSIGANDILQYVDKETCAKNVPAFYSALKTLDTNLKGTILPQLRAALTVNGVQTGDLVLLNYYDPYQNICPETVAFGKLFAQHLADDIRGFGTYVDVFAAFGGEATPNPNLCTYTWMCSIYHDFHATPKGHRVVANAIEATLGYP